LYQGTTLVVPYKIKKQLGFSPCCGHLGPRKTQGLKPRFFLNTERHD
jgi:hypothetical protein